MITLGIDPAIADAVARVRRDKLERHARHARPQARPHGRVCRFLGPESALNDTLDPAIYARDERGLL